MTETDYWSECNLVSTEIDDAMAIFHTYEEINRLALKDEYVLVALNADALFWKVQVYSLQTALFIVLGRIFDISPDAHSIHKVVGPLRSTLNSFRRRPSPLESLPML